MVEHSMIILIELKYIVSVPFDWTRTLSPIYFFIRSQLDELFNLQAVTTRIHHLENVKFYTSYLQQYTKIIKMPTL
jgi:hypothetical protein